MPIVFDQVEGVVQRGDEGAAPAGGTETESASSESRDSSEILRELELAQRRARRLLAD